MNKTRRSHGAHNKENLREAEDELTDLRQKYQAVSKYFQAVVQKDIEQKATDHLSYLSEIDSNMPASGLLGLHSHKLQEKGESLSAWQEQSHHFSREPRKLADRRKFRGFSFWSKRNSLNKERPANYSIDEALQRVSEGRTNSVICYQQQRNPTSHINELVATLVHEDPAISYQQAQATLGVSKMDEKCHNESISSNNMHKNSTSRESLNILKEKLSTSNLHGLLSNQNNLAMEDKLKLTAAPTEIEWLKQQILNNLNRQTVINRSGHFLECQVQPGAAHRPKSSYAIQKRLKLPPPPSTIVAKSDKVHHNAIKLSSLIEDCQVNLQPLATKQCKERKINRALRLSDEPRRSLTRAIDYGFCRVPNNSQVRLSIPKSDDRRPRLRMPINKRQ